MLIEIGKRGRCKGKIDWLDLWYWYRYDAPGSPPWGCPRCGSERIGDIWGYGPYGKNKRKARIHAVSKCYKCLRQFSMVTKTRFERTKIDMVTWIKVIYLIERYNFSINDLREFLNVTYVTAWKMKKVANQAIKENDLLGWGI